MTSSEAPEESAAAAEPKGPEDAKSRKDTSAEGDEEPRDPTSPNAVTSPFHLVALGASAGGLDSLCRFFDHLAADSRAAYVVLMHLAPERTSNLVHILTEHAPFPVREIGDGDEIREGHVYVPPPGTRVTVDDGCFQVSARTAPTEHVIDALFSSMAQSWGERAIGLVLSGSGNDGTQGVRDLRGEGGFTLAEDPRGAAFGDMPQNAIQTGRVDAVAPPETLAEEVTRFITFGGTAERPKPAQLDVRRVLAVVKEKRDRDFQGYKGSTVRRRIGRRMRLRHKGSVDEYVRLLHEDEKELDQLVRDLLITVTRFFRDPEAFEKLRETAVAGLLDRKSDGGTVRIWVPGCSSGEEAYSLAFLFLDEIRHRGLNVNLQIFATDLDETSLQRARGGIYPAEIEPDVPYGLGERYLKREDDTFQVNKAVRQSIIFSAHDVIRDPPFAHMDLVSCRNLLIYLESDVQRQVLSYLHYALDPDGYLFLGTSESILGSRSLFQPVAKSLKIFRKISGRRPEEFRFPTSFSGLEIEPEPEKPPAWAVERANLSRLAERALLQRYGPPGILVNLEHEVVYYFGDTGPYLKTPPGFPERDVNHLIRSELRRPLRRVLAKAEKDRVEAVSGPVRVGTAGDEASVRVAGHPVGGTGDEIPYLLLVFQTVEGGAERTPVEKVLGDDRSVVEDLEDELRETRDELRATIERKDAVNEELRSANEELISMNEELQSTNEELETAKEELQSMNEELETVNAELNSKIAELGRTNANMQNLLASTEIATLFLDGALCIKSYTRPATGLFKLIATDRGRPLMDITNSLQVDDLETPMRRVLRTLEPHEEAVSDQSGRTYIMRILPYRTEEEVIDGVVVTFIDISDRTRAEATARQLSALVQASRDAIIVVDDQGKILSWNRGATETYGYDPKSTVGTSVEKLAPKEDRESFRQLLESPPAGEGPGEFEMRRVTEDGRILNVSTSVTALEGDDSPSRIALIERDVTDRRATERHRELLLRELDHRVKNTLATVEAIAERTLVNSGHSMDDFTEALRGRIQALGRTHKALSDQKWEGIQFDRLVNQTLEPFGGEGRCLAEGKDLVLPVDLTLPMAMALHELATNAAKYGSLSASEGRVRVTWRVERDSASGRRLEMEWKEEDGPPVSEPEEKGYGMTFLERGIAYELDGEAEILFEPDGLRCRIEFPLPVGGSR